MNIGGYIGIVIMALALGAMVYALVKDLFPVLFKKKKKKE